MGFFDFLKNLFGSTPKKRLPNLTPPEQGLGTDELARRLGLSVENLERVGVDYHKFDIPKKTGGTRTITAPNPSLKLIQRRILNRLLNKLSCHGCATGFEKGHSIVTNANVHVGSEVVLKMDVIAFFTSTSADRMRGYFYGIGWGQEATDILVRLCTHNDRLPQGAPTSPRLSNLVNIEMDARLCGWAQKVGAGYTRYADDLTFSFADLGDSASLTRIGRNHPHDLVTSTIRITKKILHEYGYELHNKRKLNIRRRHQQQRVCGLVVNERVALPRTTRRRLRAIRHHIDNGKSATLTAKQLAGWDGLEQMIAAQTADSE